MALAEAPATRRLDHLTFKGNLRETRYGWLRLTPAYSVHLVGELLEAHARPGTRVLDPFCGTGTTALACAERGLACDTTDINPFLLWLARAKTRRYGEADLAAFGAQAARVARALEGRGEGWRPPLHQIDKWWDAPVLAALGRAMVAIRALDGDLDLPKLAFCRAMIEQANVSFGHQSMSFRRGVAAARPSVAESWSNATTALLRSARSAIRRAPRPIACDARDLRAALPRDRYALVVTSPPYPNRMSYVRELRPYMYWLGYLADGRAAGELDWQAIGGTWGCATSLVAKWTPPRPIAIPFAGFAAITRGIGERSPLLARYVEKYFHDMTHHVASLFQVVAPGGSVHYVVGNSKFYDVLLPVEEIFAALFEAAGFRRAEVRCIRKRTSKKELFEYVVSAEKR